ncbi:MAG: acyl-CoA carboxylase subunit epsilon [Chloroflexia bacterium]|nr:acyl-CoA carboxylase subunit epsilon [Chloroflexia bacterium]
MTDAPGKDRRPWLRVWPEPTEEELAAIVAAVSLMTSDTPAIRPEIPALPSRWARAGRLDAQRGLGYVRTGRWGHRLGLPGS